MPLELMTTSDLEKFKLEIIQEIKNLFSEKSLPANTLLRSKDVCKLLRISAGTLQNMRKNNHITCKKVSGTYFYCQEDVKKLVGINF